MTTPLRVTHLGHSCVLIEAPSGAHTVKVLLDPGTLTPELAPIDGLDAIFITHPHADHVDPGQVRRLRQAGPVPLYGSVATAALLADAGVEDARAVGEGMLEIRGMTVGISASPHEEIYPGISLPGNYCYHLAGAVFAPGDSFAHPDLGVDTLLLPIGAPWMKLSQTIDYLRAVGPRIAVPVHDGGLAQAHRELHVALLRKFAPSGTTVIDVGIGLTIEP